MSGSPTWCCSTSTSVTAVGDGAALVGPLVAAGCRVVLVTASTDPVRLATALEAGAVGVLAKTEPIEVLLAAATAAARGDQVMTHEQRLTILRDAQLRRASRSAAMSPFERLTAREAQVLRSSAAGRASRASPRTPT